VRAYDHNTRRYVVLSTNAEIKQEIRILERKLEVARVDKWKIKRKIEQLTKELR